VSEKGSRERDGGLAASLGAGTLESGKFGIYNRDESEWREASLNHFVKAGLLVGLIAVLGAAGLALPPEKAQRDEEREVQERFRKWLEDDVGLIITGDERATFLKLTTIEEREAFIDDFWKRRDPDPRTQENEVKEEHYRRIAYANDRYTTGMLGCKSDRGKIYIMLGPPDQIEANPSGGSSSRQIMPGGEKLGGLPYQIWHYRYVPGLGANVNIEFIDKSVTGNFTLVSDTVVRDWSAYNPRVSELRGERPGQMDDTDLSFIPLDGSEAVESIYEKLMRYGSTQKTPQIRYQDLREKVQGRLFQQTFPVDFQSYAFPLRGSQAVVPLSLEVDNRHLKFERRYDSEQALVDVYIVVQALDGRIVAEFDDQLTATRRDAASARPGMDKSLYQRIVLLPPGRYKVGLAVKDEFGDAISVVEKGVVIPSASPEEKLGLSSLMLARSIAPLKAGADPQDPFQIGQYRVTPNVSGIVRAGEPLGVYGHVYHASRPEGGAEPRLAVRYQVLREGHPVLEEVDRPGGVFNARDSVVVLARSLSLKGLDPGRYSLRVTVEDETTSSTAVATAAFQVQ